MLQAGAAPAGRLEQACVWRREPDGAMLERAELRRRGAGLRLHGRVVGVLAGRPFEVGYEIAWVAGGATRLRLAQAYGGELRRLELAGGPDGWRRDGRDCPELAACAEVDLGVSPSTNMLPIRRLGPDSRAFELRAAWVQFPSLSVSASRQGYERLGERRWRYRNLDSGFTAELDVDRFGLPVAYAGVWTRICALEP